MYIYHALINNLSTHMMHVNLNMIFYICVEHNPTKTIYIKYYTRNTHTHTLTQTAMNSNVYDIDLCHISYMVKEIWCLTSTETIRIIRDGEKGGKGVWRWGRGRLYTYRYTVTTSMTSALRWAAMRVILMFHNCDGQSHKTASTVHNF